MIGLKNILVATDFGEASDAALTYGRELAHKFGGRLHVMHVVDDVFAGSASVESYMSTYPRIQHEVEEAGRKQLSTLISTQIPPDIEVKSVLVTSNAPSLPIIRYARDAAIDLIVMGTHGRGALGHLFMGSVAERVVRMAPCPVLIVRYPEREFVQPDALRAMANVSS